MKLLISLTYYSPHISGLTLSMQHLAELLQNNGYGITVLAAQHEKNLPLEEKMNGVAVVRIPYLFRMSKGFVMPDFLRIVIRLLQKNDAVLITLPQDHSLLVAIVAKLLRKKIICLYICEITLQGGFGKKVINSIIKLINKITLLFADKIVTLTDDFARENAVLVALGRKITGIYPVVTPPEIVKEETRALQQKLPHKTYYIGYLGRIASEKGIDYLFETIPVLQKEFGESFAFVIAGPEKTVGEELYKKKIEAILIKYPEYIVQLGELTDRQRGAFYSLLDVFVLPSTNNTEAFGMVQVEAMYCGTPVVATNLPGVRVPVHQTGMGEIVPPKDVSALVQAIVTVLHNKKKYVKERSLIENIFSQEKILKAYQDVFTS